MVQTKRQSVTMSISLPLDVAIFLDDFAFERNYGRSKAMVVLVGIARAYFAESRRKAAEDDAVSTKKPGFPAPKLPSKKGRKVDLSQGIIYPTDDKR